MLPISPIAIGALYSAAARTARGEFQIGDAARARLDAVRGQLEDLSDLIGDFRPNAPGSWSRFLGRLMDYSFETEGRFRSAKDARSALGFTCLVDVPSFMTREGLRTLPSHTVFEDAEHLLTLVKLPNQTAVAVVSPVSDHARSQTEIWFAPAHPNTSADRILAGFAQAFWDHRTAVILDSHADGPVASSFDLSDFVYHGARLTLIDQWRRFRARGVRRNVLLQGLPGCGKSTLCFHAARELSQRTLILTPACFLEMKLAEWTATLDALSPEMLIMEDIDRIEEMGRYNLKGKLRFFEEGYCDVPIVLFSSNDASRLPAAMRRPGRIDQIVRFDEPSEGMQRRIVAQLAARQGVDIPPAHLDELVELLNEFSAAHVVEALRRAQILGWEHYGGSALAGPGDQTFLLHRDFDNAAEWLQAHGFKPVDTDAQFIVDELLSQRSEVVFSDDRQTLVRVELPNGAQICVDPDDNSYRGQQISLRPVLDGRDAAFAGIAALFWQDRDTVLLDEVGDRIQALDLPPPSQRYYGPLLDCIDDWAAFHAHGLRRNVLLQGPPGCGKSTFCRHAATLLSERTLVLTPEFYGATRCAAFRHIVDLLRPDLVIVDDVDRVSQHALESKLRLFEEGYCDIPLVLFTSNDKDKLPRPMKRPGRIDQIIVVDPPDKALRWQLIREMAARVGVDPPEERLNALDAVLQNQSTAHLIEALRRARVLGWEADPIPGDETFATPDNPEADIDTQNHHRSRA